MSEPKKTDRLGVSRLEYYYSSHGWLFREQPIHDYGIDAQVEIVRDGKPTGDLLAIQIKSGQSYFAERTDTAFVYRTNGKHINYWLKHCLPVIVVLYNPEEDTLYWESASCKTIIDTGQDWKINIPKSNILTAESLGAFRKLSQPPSYIQKLNKLRLDKAWIQMVADGEIIYIEFEDWINKSLPRFTIRIGCDSRDDIEEEHWPVIYGARLSIPEAISYAIPWADYDVDENAYDDSTESAWGPESYMERDDDEGIRPFSADGEMEYYRLLLSVNELGQAFLALDAYLTREEHLQNRIFTLESEE